jgi:TRAP-type C4-dicarboxylate transport system permease small subunit
MTDTFLPSIIHMGRHMTVFFKKIDHGFLKLLNAIIIVSNLAILVIILFLITSRLFGWSVIGLLELATMSAMWLYMSGAVLAARNREHLVVDFMSQRLKNSKIIVIHNLIIALIMLVLGLFFLSLANDMLAFSMKRPQTTPALSLPLLLPQTAIFAGAIFTTTYAVRDLALACTQFFKTSHG